MLSTLATRFRGGKVSFRTNLRRSLPICLLAALTASGLAATAGWQRHAPAPEPRTEVAAAFARGEIVAVGGFTENGGSSGRADAYSVAPTRWRRLPDLPLAVDHAAA